MNGEVGLVVKLSRWWRRATAGAIAPLLQEYRARVGPDA